MEIFKKLQDNTYRHKRMNMRNGIYILLCTIIFLLPACSRNKSLALPLKPNILLVITDDQSWEHAGCYGDQVIRTPSIDRLSREGIRFENAYTACPSCSPSRAAILTGQDIYRLEEGGVLTGFIRDKYVLFPKILAEGGYHVGSTGKRYWPRTQNVEGAVDEPIGKVYNVLHQEAIPEGISRLDYSASLKLFLEEKQSEDPFFFWVGTSEPHMPYESNRGIKTGIDTSAIRIPGFIPDVSVARLDLADYMSEIEWADRALGEMIRILEEKGMLETTLVIFTSDNGMPFPRSKATLYDHGVRMPLVMRWGSYLKGGGLITNPVSLIDLGPTFLDLAGMKIPEQMTGRSMKNLLIRNESGFIEGEQEFVVSAFEKHVLARPDSLGFPRRAIHTEKWTYIINYEPDRYPMGTEEIHIPWWDNFGETDPSRTKEYFKENMHKPEFSKFWELGFGKVPAEELYQKKEDPDMLFNLAQNPEYAAIKASLRKKLGQYLMETSDPRARGLSPWDAYNLDKPVPPK